MRINFIIKIKFFSY